MSRRRQSFPLWLLLLLLFCNSAYANRIQLKHSDSLRTTQAREMTTYEFIGNVHFVKDSSDLSADRAVWYEAGDLVRLVGNVRIAQPRRRLVCDSLRYDQHSELAIAYGRVILEDRQRHVRVEGDHGVFSEIEEILVMTGGTAPGP